MKNDTTIVPTVLCSNSSFNNATGDVIQLRFATRGGVASILLHQPHVSCSVGLPDVRAVAADVRRTQIESRGHFNQRLSGTQLGLSDRSSSFNHDDGPHDECPLLRTVARPNGCFDTVGICLCVRTRDRAEVGRVISGRDDMCLDLAAN